mmetsp:Transcript_7115/g.13484  ORF Transcript_7115/g.13484 Transcript_7115/m.13484 type:complete len:90 (-) Transcript_7115:3692-3961(-)
MRNVAEFRVFGLKAPSGTKDGSYGSRKHLDNAVIAVMNVKWIANCVAIEVTTCLHKTDGGGLWGDNLLTGSPFVTKKNNPATMIPTTVS